jgi:hypothetical protein
MAQPSMYPDGSENPKDGSAFFTNPTLEILHVETPVLTGRR